jgi:hypothetical protein
MSENFGLNNNFYNQDPSLNNGEGSNEFGISGALNYLDSTSFSSGGGFSSSSGGGFSSSSGGGFSSSSGGGNGFWGNVENVVSTLQQVNSILDQYILTPKQQMELNIQRTLAQADLARAKAEEKKAEEKSDGAGYRHSSIQVRPLMSVMSPWMWIVLVGLGVLVLVLLLKE